VKHSALLVFATAAVLGAASTAPVPIDQRMMIAVAVVVLFAAAAWRRESSAFRVLIAGALIAGATCAWYERRSEPVFQEMRTARYTGVVLGDEQVSNGSVSFSCALDNGPTVLASVYGSSPPPLGARVLLRGRIEPFDEARNPDEPSERDIESERGLQAHLVTAQILSILPAPTFSPTHIDRALVVVLARVHGWALTQLRTYLPEPQASVVAGELWGERSALPPELHEEFQETGTVHILVTAGLHLGVVAALIVWLLQEMYAPRLVTCIVTICCAWAYAIFAGAHEPALRAATMLSFALVGRACGRKALSCNALGAAALLFAFLRPLQVTGASFLLSFSCVGAIFVSATPIGHWLEARWALPERVREAIALAIATQLGTWPLTAAIFLQFSPYSILANICVVPVVGCTMLLAGAQFAFAWLPPIAQAVANLNGWLLAWILSVVHIMATLPHARITMTPAPAWCIAIYDLALLTAPLVLSKGGRYLCIATITMAAALVLWPPRLPNHTLRITVLDVGQADGIVIQTPGGHTLLVDAGGQLERGGQSATDSSAEKVGERIVVPFLVRHGIHALDTIILSHPHGDHVGGCRPVLLSVRVGEVADSGQQYGGNAYHDCIDTARSQHVPVVYPRAGTVWKSNDGVILYFIGPQLPFLKNTGNDINDNSVAFILQYKHFRMLFTGDAGFAAEERFLRVVQNVIPSERASRGSIANVSNREDILPDLHADILKVGHHGSAYSSSPEFLAAIHPRYAIISVGRYNHFGHPAPHTLTALQQVHARIYRTDQNAAVIITTNGKNISVTSLL